MVYWIIPNTFRSAGWICIGTIIGKFQIWLYYHLCLHLTHLLPLTIPYLNSWLKNPLDLYEYCVLENQTGKLWQGYSGWMLTLTGIPGWAEVDSDLGLKIGELILPCPKASHLGWNAVRVEINHEAQRPLFLPASRSSLAKHDGALCPGLWRGSDSYSSVVQELSSINLYLGGRILFQWHTEGLFSGGSYCGDVTVF